MTATPASEARRDSERPASEVRRDSEARRQWLDAVALVVSFGGPFVLAATRAPAVCDWKHDARLASSLGGAGALQGRISDLWIQLWMALPIGSSVLRAAWASSVALGTFGCLVFALARQMTRGFVHAPRTSLLLAVLAALMATLSSTPLSEGASIGGGAAAALLGMALVAGGERLCRIGRPTQWRSTLGGEEAWIGIGAIAGALCAESVWVGVVTVATVLVRVTASPWLDRVPTVRGGRISTRAPSRNGPALAEPELIPRSLRIGMLAAAGVSALVILPPLVAAVATRSELGWLGSVRDWWRAARAVNEGLASQSETVIAEAAISIFARELGSLPMALSLVGAAIAMMRREVRACGVSLLALVVCEIVASRLPGRMLGTVDRAGLRLLALAALAISVSCALAQVGDLVAGMRVRASRSALVFLVMFDVALVAASAEEATFAASSSGGADRYVDEALEQLPPSAVVLVQSRVLLDRLMAARVAFGMRPDVVVVPYPRITTATAALALLGQHPALTDVLRDFAMEDRPLERSLSALSDKRPVYVEFDPAWDRRVVSHLLPDHLWFRFHPEPRGAAERRASFVSELARIDSILESMRGEVHEDGSSKSSPDGSDHARAADGAGAALGRDGRKAGGDAHQGEGDGKRRDGAVRGAGEGDGRHKDDGKRGIRSDSVPTHERDRALDARAERENVAALARMMRSYVVVARDLGDRDMLSELLGRLSQLVPDDPFVSEFQGKLEPYSR